MASFMSLFSLLCVCLLGSSFAGSELSRIADEIEEDFLEAIKGVRETVLLPRRFLEIKEACLAERAIKEEEKRDMCRIGSLLSILEPPFVSSGICPSIPCSSASSRVQPVDLDRVLTLAMAARFRNMLRGGRGWLTFLRTEREVKEDVEVFLCQVLTAGSALHHFSLPGEGAAVRPLLDHKMVRRGPEGDAVEIMGIPLRIKEHIIEKKMDPEMVGGYVPRYFMPLQKAGVIVYARIPTLSSSQKRNPAPLSALSSLLRLPENVREDLVFLKAEGPGASSLSDGDIEAFLNKQGLFKSKTLSESARSSMHSALSSASEGARLLQMLAPRTKSEEELQEEVDLIERNENWPQQVWVFVPLVNPTLRRYSSSTTSVAHFFLRLHKNPSPLFRNFKELGLFYKLKEVIDVGFGHRLLRLRMLRRVK